MKKRSSLVLLVVMAVIVPMVMLTSCTQKAATTTPDTTTPAKQLTFVMVPKGVHPYYIPCYQGFVDAGAKYGIKVEEAVPQKFEVPLQVQVIEDLIAQKVDGIAISANDDAGLVPVIAQATKAGIKVITLTHRLLLPQHSATSAPTTRALVPQLRSRWPSLWATRAT